MSWHAEEGPSPGLAIEARVGAEHMVLLPLNFRSQDLNTYRAGTFDKGRGG